MTRAQALLRALAALTALAFATGAVVGGPARAAGSGQEAFSFADSRINEASALVVLPGAPGSDRLSATINDSGDTGRVFVVDSRGRTVGLTRWEKSPRDVEALALAPDGEVWVGDIGDNSASRPHLQVAKVPVGASDQTVRPTVYDLVYPDGAHDAETLLCDPATGRLYLASKGWLGGTLYAAPEKLVAGQDNKLTAVGAVMPMATDGVFLPGGHEVLIRGYFSATTYAWPSMDKIASFRLPEQPQGEGVGVAQDGTVYLSSEGLHSAVLRFELPARATATGSGAARGSATTPAEPVEAQRTTLEGDGIPAWWPWTAGGLVGVVLITLLVLSLRRR